MTPILHASRNLNPRLAVAVARYLDAPVTINFAAPLASAEAKARFRPLNPNLRLPILEFGDGRTLWETDAIACRLSRDTGSTFWRQDDDQPEMIRWLTWAHGHFFAACEKLHWEFVTKQRYGIGPVDEANVAEGLAGFAASAAILSDHLASRDWLVGDAPSYADFRMGCVLPFADVARLPLADHPVLARWHDRLMALPHWADPFSGLDIPELPPLP